ncbi:hypothetical protein KKA17_11535, partial [bacterium]|nr:hypothetical protein [bacterium]MBU1884308.1 hypothetical protein [bacterium]
DDTLMGYDGYGTIDNESDILKGGNDFDTYIAGNNDIIIDSDGKGEIYFEGKQLTGGTDSLGDGTYTNGTLSYKLDGTTLTITDSKTGHTLTVKDLQPSETTEGEDHILDVGLGIQLQSSTKQTTAPTGATYVTVNTTDEWHQYQIPIYATDKDGKTYIDHYENNPAYIVHWAGSSFSADDNSNLINLLPGGGTIDGGGGDDHFQVNSGSQTLTGVATMSLMSSPSTGGFSLYGGDGNDTFNANNDGNVIDGGSGADTITVGNDATIETGSGADTVTAGEYATVTNKSGSDSITTGDNANITGSMWAENISVGSNSLHVEQINQIREVA